MSLTFLFYLIGLSQLSFSETLAIGAVATHAVHVEKQNAPPAVATGLFNIAALTMPHHRATHYHLPRIQQ